MKMRKAILSLLLICLAFTIVASCLPGVFAASAYKTYTLDRHNELIETNEAYEAVTMIRTLDDASTLDGAKDIFIDANDYIYIADTGNRRVVILDPKLEVVASFGDDRLIKPTGLAVVDDLIYIADYGLAATNEDIGSIHVYEFRKSDVGNTYSVTWVRSLSTPVSDILEAEGFLFRPTKIAVDNAHVMYIVNEGTTNGVMMVDDNNRFINYFASNPLKISLWERLERIIYRNNENVNLTKNIPIPVTNIAIDNQGYYYTITQTAIENNSGENIRKVNLGSLNYYPDEMYTHGNVVDAWTGDVENLYVLTQDGVILEYDSLGNLLFQFAGKGTGNDKLGLFLSASAIAQDSSGNIYVIDDNASRNTIQVFRETPFATRIHEAMALYNEAKYVESISVWEDVLRYNSMFDMAYRGIGLGYMMNEDYDEALTYFTIAGDKESYSDCYWEIRNIWLIEHIDMIFVIIILVMSAWIAFAYYNRKYRLVTGMMDRIKSQNLPPVIGGVGYMFRFIKHPVDACYEIKRHQRVSAVSASLFLFLVIAIYVASLVFTGFIFNPVIIEETILFNEVMKIFLPVVIFVFANYLVSSLMEGEGTLKATYVNTIGALTPVLLIFPFAIVISNFITANEAFLYSFSLVFMLSWSGSLLYFNIKETHNYTVGQTFVNLFLTLLMMVVIIITMIMVYLMVFQVGNFVSDLVKEVIIRE